MLKNKTKQNNTEQTTCQKKKKKGVWLSLLNQSPSTKEVKVTVKTETQRQELMQRPHKSDS